MTQGRTKVNLPDDTESEIESLSDEGPYQSKSKAVADLAETGLAVHEHQQQLFDNRWLSLALSSGIGFLVLFAVAVVLNWSFAAPLAMAGVTLLASLAYAVQVWRIMAKLNGGRP